MQVVGREVNQENVADFLHPDIRQTIATAVAVGTGGSPPGAVPKDLAFPLFIPIVFTCITSSVGHVHPDAREGHTS
jgi:hypothetical protein